MRSSNPVFSRRGFSRDNGYAGFNARAAGRGPRREPVRGQPVRAGRQPVRARPVRPAGPPARRAAAGPAADRPDDDGRRRHAHGHDARHGRRRRRRRLGLLPVDADLGSPTASRSAPAWSRWCWRWSSPSSARPSPALILAYAALRGRLPRRRSAASSTACIGAAPPCRRCWARWRSSPPCWSPTRRGWIRVNRALLRAS